MFCLLSFHKSGDQKKLGEERFDRKSTFAMSQVQIQVVYSHSIKMATEQK